MSLESQACKRREFSVLDIREEESRHVLTNKELFDRCQASGDPEGTLEFYVILDDEQVLITLLEYFIDNLIS
jgi:hypothetical protein